MTPQPPQGNDGCRQVASSQRHVGLQPDEIDVQSVLITGNFQLFANIVHAITEHADLRPTQRYLCAIAFGQIGQFGQHHVSVEILAIGKQPGGQSAKMIDVEGAIVLHARSSGTFLMKNHSGHTGASDGVGFRPSG
jgi:hypothetical protein